MVRLHTINSKLQRKCSVALILKFRCNFVEHFRWNANNGQSTLPSVPLIMEDDDDMTETLPDLSSNFSAPTMSSAMSSNGIQPSTNGISMSNNKKEKSSLPIDSMADLLEDKLTSSDSSSSSDSSDSDSDSNDDDDSAPNSPPKPSSTALSSDLILNDLKDDLQLSSDSNSDSDCD